MLFSLPVCHKLDKWWLSVFGKKHSLVSCTRLGSCTDFLPKWERQFSWENKTAKYKYLTCSLNPSLPSSKSLSASSRINHSTLQQKQSKTPISEIRLEHFLNHHFMTWGGTVVTLKSGPCCILYCITDKLKEIYLWSSIPGGSWDNRCTNLFGVVTRISKIT